MANIDLNRPADVYIATNLVNGKIYVGVTTKGRLGKRIYEHTRDSKKLNTKFYKAIRKHGIQNFYFEVVESHPSMAAGFVAEIRLIAELSPAYNSTKGGEGASGVPISPEGRERQKAACRGNKWRLGKTHTPEVKERLRQAAIANPIALKTFGHLGPEAASKKVVCLNTGEIYKSASFAARVLGLDKNVVIQVCQRNKKRVTAGGDLIFRYLGDHHGGVEEAREEIRRRRILSNEVVCLDNGKIFSSLLEAAATNGIAKSTLQRHCADGRPLRCGLRFVYAEDVE